MLYIYAYHMVISYIFFIILREERGYVCVKIFYEIRTKKRECKKNIKLFIRKI